jgi:hypothetical protein
MLAGTRAVDMSSSRLLISDNLEAPWSVAARSSGDISTMEGGVECGVREVSDLEVALQDSRGAVEGQGEFEVDSETFHVGGSGELRFK